MFYYTELEFKVEISIPKKKSVNFGTEIFIRFDKISHSDILFLFFVNDI